MAARALVLASLIHKASSFRVVKNEESRRPQFTPDPADWLTFQTKPLNVRGITAHDPDSIGWIQPETWKAAEWDGTTTYDPRRMSRSAFVKAICPSPDTVRGIREVFYRVNPFADNTNPTKAEVDEWHRVAINHIRALVGYNTSDRQVQPDTCMFARAQWGEERARSTMWDAKYPANGQRVYGPCGQGSPAHCGATFVPNAEDQKRYLPRGHSPCRVGAGAEGIFSGPKSDIPWSIKWSRGICNTLVAEGFCGGHVGPWFRREKFGFAFWDAEPSNRRSNAILRGKWTGRLMSNPLCE